MDRRQLKIQKILLTENELEEMGVSCGIGEVIYGSDLELLWIKLLYCPKCQSANPAKTVDANPSCHVFPPFKNSLTSRSERSEESRDPSLVLRVTISLDKCFLIFYLFDL